MKLDVKSLIIGILATSCLFLLLGLGFNQNKYQLAIGTKVWPWILNTETGIARACIKNGFWEVNYTKGTVQFKEAEHK